MIGKELAKQIRKTKGKIMVPIMLINDAAWVVGEKTDMIKQFDHLGETETGYFVETDDRGENFLTRDYTKN